MWTLRAVVNGDLTRWEIRNAAGELGDSWRWQWAAAQVVEAHNATWILARELEREWQLAAAA